MGRNVWRAFSFGIYRGWETTVIFLVGIEIDEITPNRTPAKTSSKVSTCARTPYKTIDKNVSGNNERHVMILAGDI